jgi:arylsulfatase
MKSRKTIGALSIMIMLGFIAGLVHSIYFNVIPNQYFLYKMHTMVALSLQKYLNKWVTLSLFLFIALLMSFYIIKIIWNLSGNKILTVNVKDEALMAGCIIGFILFCSGVWAINHYLLPGIFHPVSLLGDIGVLLLSILLGWIIIKVEKQNVLEFKINRYLSTTALVLALFWVSLNVYASIKIPKGPNVILITVDTLRADHLGCYGYNRNTSPNVDKFAKDSLLFEKSFSHAPVTSSSFSSILSGFMPHETSVYRNNALPSDINTVTEFLKNEGYKTVAVVSNFVLRKTRGFEQGFDIYNDKMMDEELVRLRPERLAEQTTVDAVAYLKKYYKNKFFMWIHYQDPHGPYTPKPPFNNQFRNDSEKSLTLKFSSTPDLKGGIPSYQMLGENRDFNYYVSQYDGEILYFDTHFKTLIETLKELNVYDNSLIIFTADHGEGMGEHDYYFTHGETLFNTCLHVPLIVKYKKETFGRRKDFVQSADIVPTILEVVGIDTDLNLRGRNLLSKSPDERNIFSETEDSYSIIADKTKSIYRGSDKKYLVFDLRNDFDEGNDIMTHINSRESVKYLKENLEYMRNENMLGIEVVNKTRAATDEEKEKLKALGYIQ